MAGEKGRPKIILLETGGFGGIHNYAHALANGLAGCEVELIFLTTERYEMEDQPCHFELLRLLRREAYWRTLRRVWRVFRSCKPDVLHVQSFIAPRKDLALLLLCRLLRIKVVLTVHNILPHEVRPFERALYFLYYRLAQGLILHSDLNRQRLREMVPDLEGERLHVVPHGNSEQFRYLETSREQARRRLHLPPDATIALFFGSVRPYKGLDLLIAAMPEVLSACPKALLLVAGHVEVGNQEEYEAQIADLDLGPEGLVQRYGYLSNEDMICYVRAADLVVLPYREIYQSGVVFLAYTFGRAVLATRVGSFPETVEEGRSGWLVEPEDVPGLSRALVAALSAPDKLREAGDYARHLADTRYGWPDIARQTEKVYRRALEDE
ncbi:MAG: glycosyltransferase family 4 protein [Gemmatimonadetes bacterium]|jgi:glycosyltransferase involved in cell wall biosynthesis|nr:glycosyltransferase family 4 protein [Gemmatimonadota bacterium]MBT5448471.1 glycosyltransferase family 4 protein [Gemmatimonadota bacterium]MBT7420872.1 glycosyltransferase family 4 protein [Gemmatimonadota bacterium]